MRISKGLIMPSMIATAWRLIRQSDVVNLHIPQLDAVSIAWIARLMGKPVVMTYQCDLQLPRGPMNAVINRISSAANHLAAWSSRAITSITRDYAGHSRFLRRHARKVLVMGAPVKPAAVSDEDVSNFRRKHHLKDGQRILGMASRLATEKGVEILVEALPEILKEFPAARILFVGPYENVLGEEAYAARIMPLIRGLRNHWTFLGQVSDVEMTAFFKTIEVLIFPSLNSTEAYGLAQAEAMTCGTPVVASDLPGVRVPVRETGMGLVVRPGDVGALARAVIEVLAHPDRFKGRSSTSGGSILSPEALAERFEGVFVNLCRGERPA